MNPRFLSLISLTMKAGKLLTGETSAVNSLRNGSAALVIVAGDASDNTKKKFVNKCFYYNIPSIICGSKATLSKCAGRENRSVFAVTDVNLAKRLISLQENE